MIKKLELFIIHGIPGSGKSTLARKICDRRGLTYDRISDNDSFFMKDGIYHFDGTIHYLARKACEAHSAVNLWQYGFSIVANTFCRYHDMENIIEDAAEIGKALDVHPEIIVVEPDGNTPFKDVDFYLKRNVHGVPRQVIEAMMHSWEPNDQRALEEFVIHTVGLDALVKLLTESEVC